MKKILAGLVVTFVVAMMSLGFTSSAHAVDGYGSTSGSDGEVLSGGIDGEVLSGGADAEASTASGSGILPATGGPQTLLLIGGAALVAVGGVALVATRRRVDAS